MFCPARKDKKFGRPIGGVAVYYKNINEHAKRLFPECNFDILIQVHKHVFGTEKHILF